MINTTVSDWRKYFRVVFFSASSLSSVQYVCVCVLNSSSLLLLRLFLGCIIRLCLTIFVFIRTSRSLSLSTVATHTSYAHVIVARRHPYGIKIVNA